MENHEDESIKINRSPKEGLKKKRMDHFPPLIIRTITYSATCLLRL